MGRRIVDGMGLYAVIAADELRQADDEPNAERRVELLHNAARNLDVCLRAEVLALREAGETWATIGRLLGVTRQGAQQRFGRAIR